MAMTNETKAEAVKKTATKHKAAPATEPKGEKKGNKKGKKVEKPENGLVIPMHLRGVIKSSAPKGGNTNKPKRLGGDMTNAEFAKEKGITTRQASKVRMGKRKLVEA